MILKVIQLSRSGRPAGVHCDYSDGMPLFPSMVREVAGMNGAHPTVLALSQKETRVYIGTDKSAVFQASSLHVIIVHHAVVLASGYVQQCSAWLNLPESKHHLCPVSEVMEYPAQEDNLLLFAEVSVLGLVGGLERSAKFCSADAVSSPNYEENSLPEVHQPSTVVCLLTCWVKKEQLFILQILISSRYCS